MHCVKIRVYVDHSILTYLAFLSVSHIQAGFAICRKRVLIWPFSGPLI